MIYFVKLYFQQLNLLQSSLLHDPSEIITLLDIVIYVQNSCAAWYFCWNHDTFCFKILMDRLWFEIDFFCNIINIFNVMFDQFN